MYENKFSGEVGWNGPRDSEFWKLIMWPRDYQQNIDIVSSNLNLKTDIPDFCEIWK